MARGKRFLQSAADHGDRQETGRPGWGICTGVNIGHGDEPRGATVSGKPKSPASQSGRRSCSVECPEGSECFWLAAGWADTGSVARGICPHGFVRKTHRDFLPE